IVIAKYALCYIEVSSYNHAFGGVGIVVAAVEDDARTKVHARSSRFALQVRVSIVDTVRIGVAERIIKCAAYYTHKQIIPRLLFRVEIQLKAVFAQPVLAGLACRVADPIKIEREIEVANASRNMHRVSGQPPGCV